jgi:hypothetical protein
MRVNMKQISPRFPGGGMKNVIERPDKYHLWGISDGK